MGKKPKTELTSIWYGIGAQNCYPSHFVPQIGRRRQKVNKETEMDEAGWYTEIGTENENRVELEMRKSLRNPHSSCCSLLWFAEDRFSIPLVHSFVNGRGSEFLFQPMLSE